MKLLKISDVLPEDQSKKSSQSISTVAKNVAISAEGLGFHSQTGQIVQTLANGSP